eukprot:CAMPEP_0119381512 /NCGR_PEP_ID=MMETSP1334-20130426/65292_1 /TAXON_ID=127549 /ORGANISM="Calcidiscus leptoporus, Strain RCC1130" /LENGTH=55 /DNA_ID=CAMNT_0007401673 /DNA_START=21 /DNA_END=185 /DNA_ORIENTATION=+
MAQSACSRAEGSARMPESTTAPSAASASSTHCESTACVTEQDGRCDTDAEAHCTS